MMPLQMDVNRYNIAETVIDRNILKQIEDDLDIDEKISILFLIANNYANAFTDIFNLFKKSKVDNVYIIIDYVKNHPENWEDKILEALCNLNNREIIRKLGVQFKDLDLEYIPRYKSYSRSINLIAKCLYALCESMDESQQKLLLQSVKSEIVNYEPLLDNVDCLELHILYWIQIGYITISKDKKINLARLLQHFKKSENLKIISLVMNLEKFENHQHVVDSRDSAHNCTDQIIKYNSNHNKFLPHIDQEDRLLAKRHEYKKNIPLINNGLCVIINESKFKDKYDPRDGSSADTSNLNDTFNYFEFTVDMYENLNREEILKTIKNLREQVHRFKKYDCIFLFILSHGYKGGIISAEEEEVSLEEIEKAFCCMELKDVMKIVFVQACQGKICGNKNNCLTTDGLFDPSPESIDVRQFTNFFMFMSTIQGYVSMRHPSHGTWFIQEVCKIFRAFGNELTFLQCVRKIMLAVQEKQGTIGENQVAQLAEIRLDRLDSDFQLKCQKRIPRIQTSPRNN